MKEAFNEYQNTSSDQKKKNHLTYQQEWASNRLEDEPEDVQEEVDRLWKASSKPKKGKAKKEDGKVAPEPVPDRAKLEEYDR